MSKNFYVVVPYDPPAISFEKGNLMDTILSPFSAKQAGSSMGQEKFEEQRTQLFQRVDAATQGLIRTVFRLKI